MSNRIFRVGKGNDDDLVLVGLMAVFANCPALSDSDIEGIARLHPGSVWCSDDTVTGFCVERVS